MKTNYALLIRTSLVIFITFCIASCTSNDSIVPPSEYPNQLVGIWQGTIGDEKETMMFNADSTFICKVHPRGFIANTLSQTLPGTIRGTWNINGSTITMNITREKNLNAENRVASSIIISFKQNSIELKSNSGGISVFKRTLNF